MLQSAVCSSLNHAKADTRNFMKLVCTQNDLNTNLSLVSRAVPSRPTHPVLANVKLEADVKTQQVSLTGFDLSLGIQTKFAAQVEENGQLTLPAKLLNDIVSRLPEGEITLDDEAGEALCNIRSASGRYQVRGMGIEEFPELPFVEKGEAILLPAAALIEGLKGSLFATSPDETKQVLTGVHLTVKQDSLEFAATDGHRLAVVQTTNRDEEEGENLETEGKGERFAQEFEVTVPARALRELERMIGMRQSTESLILRFDQGQIVFEWADQRMTSRTLEGQYPNYRQLIPHFFERQINVERRQLLSSLERIAVLADQKNNLVKFTIDSVNQQLSLSVETQDVGSGREAMDAQISGEDLEIAFNVKYFMDGLKALPSSEIQIQLNQSTSPVILSPLSGLKMTYLVMPVQIRS